MGSSETREPSAAVRLGDRLAHLPTAPGVYIMKDGRGEPFYVGKAANLRARVRSYFGGGDHRAFVQLLDDLLEEIEVVVVRTEQEALLLENRLIKEHRPRFNVRLRDDKSFLSLRLDLRGMRAALQGRTAERARRFPRLRVVRRAEEDGSHTFGPFPSAAAVRQTLRLVNRHFGLRTCTDRTLRSRQRPCILFQMGRCAAPCTEEVPETDYARRVEDVVLFLSGRHADLLDGLRRRMAAAADRLAYERAAQLRDQIRAVEEVLRGPGPGHGRRDATDLLGYARAGHLLVLGQVPVRGGLLGRPVLHTFRDLRAPDGEVLSSLAVQLYSTQADADLPDVVLLPFSIPEQPAFAEWLTSRRRQNSARRRRVSVRVPRRGAARQLLQVAERNAQEELDAVQRAADTRRDGLARLQRRLRLPVAPRRIECFDVSQMGGTSAVAAKVLFVEGEAAREGYRRYAIRNVRGQDDFAMLYEALRRRLRRGVDEGDLPDLLLVDGGKGQLGVAEAVCRDLGISGLALAGIAKSRRPSGPGPDEVAEVAVTASPERLFVSGRKDPLVLHPHTAECALIERVRDEAHRFAITFHRSRRQRATVRSALDDIPGVGPARRRVLLRHFQSVRAIRGASVDELAAVRGISVRLAHQIHAVLHAVPGAPLES